MVNPGGTKGAFFWLSAFYFVYCARPEDWVPGMHYVPLAKITAGFCLLSMFASSVNSGKERKDLPLESRYLLSIIVLMVFSAFLSPAWKGGALANTLEFSKCYVAWVMTYLIITTFQRLRKILFIQTASVALIAIISIIKGHQTPRLAGILGGMYSNPNDLAFAIVLSLPFCLAFLLASQGPLKKLAWIVGSLAMVAALFLTASRAGFVTLVISGSVCLWHFGVRGKRPLLLISVAVVGVLLLATVGSTLKDRLEATTDESGDAAGLGAHGSYEQRVRLMAGALATIERYPILGIGANDFISYGGEWHEVHMTYLQVAVEGGIPMLIIYLMFFARGFRNMRSLRRTPNLSTEEALFIGALHSSLVGFVVGALFAPEAYQFFPYFAVAYSCVLVRLFQSEKPVPVNQFDKMQRRQLEVYGEYSKPDAVAPVR
jgi:O-antigen ligase